MKNFKYTLLLICSTSVMAASNGTLPDPTRPANYIDTNEPIVFEEVDIQERITWKLAAIRISKNDKTAIVNGQLVREGDVVGSAKVLEIKAKSVLIDHGDQKLIVRLFNNEIVKDYKASK